MIYYKLTCIKELPEVEEGFSCTLSEYELNEPWLLLSRNREENRKMCALKAYADNDKFVEKKVDLSYAFPELKCPKCDNVSLFNYKYEIEPKYDDGVTTYYTGVGLECGLCGYKQKLVKVQTGCKVRW